MIIITKRKGRKMKKADAVRAATKMASRHDTHSRWNKSTGRTVKHKKSARGERNDKRVVSNTQLCRKGKEVGP